MGMKIWAAVMVLCMLSAMVGAVGVARQPLKNDVFEMSESDDEQFSFIIQNNENRQNIVLFVVKIPSPMKIDNATGFEKTFTLSPYTNTNVNLKLTSPNFEAIFPVQYCYSVRGSDSGQILMENFICSTFEINVGDCDEDEQNCYDYSARVSTTNHTHDSHNATVVVNNVSVIDVGVIDGGTVNKTAAGISDDKKLIPPGAVPFASVEEQDSVSASGSSFDAFKDRIRQLTDSSQSSVNQNASKRFPVVFPIAFFVIAGCFLVIMLKKGDSHGSENEVGK